MKGVKTTKKNIYILMTVVLCTLLITGVSYAAETVTGNISVDGESSDWNGVTGNAVDTTSTGSSCVESWKIAYSPDGQTLYICYEGTTPGVYYTDFLDRNLLITQNGNTSSIRIGNIQYYGEGFDIKYVNNAADWGTPGSYVVEVAIPVSYFSDSSFSIAIEGVIETSAAVSAADIPVLDGNDASELPSGDSDSGEGEESGDEGEESGNEGEESGSDSDDTDSGETGENGTAYEGIVIDGDFLDWDGVAKHEATCPHAQHTNCLETVAAVYDGDYLYFYIEEGAGGNASSAGSFSNGMFSITTDLGRNLVFQLNPDGTVSGIEGVTAVHVNGQWEIAIPASELPQHLESLNISLYQGEVLVGDLVNLQTNTGNVGSFDGIVYDGLYGDWDAYPHSLIEYATAGTQEVIADGEGALYVDGSTLYGHVVSPMIAHITQGGGELTKNITIRFNEDWNTAFYPRLVAVDENGNIDWNPQLSNLEPGKYEFYMASLDSWGTSSNISDLNDMDTLYGKITITVRGDSLADEAEFYLDLELIAEKLGMDATEFKTIQGMFGEIGHDWITTAGASSGAVAGIAISLATVAAVLFFERVRTNKTGASGAKKRREV